MGSREAYILAQIDSQKAYVTVADNIEKLMIELHTRLRGHKIHRPFSIKFRPGIEKEISKYNAMEINRKEETSCLLHHFFKLDNFGMTLSDVPCWVNSPEMRQAIQIYLQIQALHQEIAIIRAEVMRAIKWAMENLKALIAYARENESVDADFAMEEPKMQKPRLEELIERAYSCLPSLSQDKNSDGELVAEGCGGVIDSYEDFIDEEDEYCIPTDVIFELAMLSVGDNQADNREDD
ncbi:hypothetical protein V1527DRAFT_499358 [Lipomyces starkeyi]